MHKPLADAAAGLVNVHAEALAARLWAASERDGWERVRPLWADGGEPRGVRSTHFAPGRHVLAAYPERVTTWRLAADTPPGAVTAWLRAELPEAGPARTPLVVCALAYDAGRNVASLADGLAREARADPAGLPDAVLAVYPAYLVGVSATGPWELVGTPSPAFRAALDEAALDEAALDETAGMPMAGLVIADGLVDPIGFAPYAAGIGRVLAGIAAGDLYQANIARELHGQVAGAGAAAATALFRAWRAAQPNAFAALWSLGADAFLVSNSPECLLAWDAATRTARSYPIKGTAPRGVDLAADAAAARDLTASSKDAAEHVMIVDLVRNDLGRVAVPGTVAVPALMAPYPLATLHHLVSEVVATVRADCDLADLVAALFPGGSITGAPKIAAMNLIDAVEPFRRGYYCGSLGLVFGGAEAVFSILIRTAIIAGGTLTYATGGGIVADSRADAEWAETEVKAHALALALAAVLPPSAPAPNQAPRPTPEPD